MAFVSHILHSHLRRGAKASAPSLICPVNKARADDRGNKIKATVQLGWQKKMDRYDEDDDIDSIPSVRSHDSSSDEESSSSEDPEMEFRYEWQRVKDNDPQTTIIEMYGGDDIFEGMTHEDWEQFGHDVANNSHLEYLTLCDGALNDLKTTSLSQGLTGSNSINAVYFANNDFGLEGVQSMVPFLQNAVNLKKVDVSHNNIGSEGFKLLMRALSNSPIRILYCWNCVIESVEIDDKHC